MKDFSKTSRIRTYIQDHGSTMRGGRMRAIGCTAFRPNEGGVVNQSVSVELEPIAGRLITPITAEVRSIYVPILAADVARNEHLLSQGDPTAVELEYAGNAEIMRKRLIDRDILFPLVSEDQVSKYCGINPRGFPAKVNSVLRYADRAAVNYMRRRMYTDATLLGPTFLSAGEYPALLSSTALDIFRGVLSPDKHINGTVSLTGEAPVKGIGFGMISAGNASTSQISFETGSDSASRDGWYIVPPTAASANQDNYQTLFVQDDGYGSFPNIRAMFDGDAKMSLTQFLQAEKQDELVRFFRAIIEQNPEYGPDMVSRYVHGLEVDTGKVPFELFRRAVGLNAQLQYATDGPSLDVERTNTDARMNYSFVVPKNEFGGLVITYLSVKPEEVFANQPDPIMTELWEVDNFAADELVVDPVAVTAEDLDCDVSIADKDNVMMYVGNNELKRSYVRRGLSRDVDVSTVEHKSTLWRYNIPASVSPDNILYPNQLDHYPFELNNPEDDAISYNFVSSATIQTPTIYGPSPIEEVDVVEDEDLFDEDE